MSEKELVEQLKQIVLHAEQEAMKQSLNAKAEHKLEIEAKADGVMELCKAIAYVVYKIIELLKDRDIVVERGENVYSRILDKVKPLDDFIANIINSNYVKYEKINDDLQAMGDYSGVRVYLFKKTMYFSVQHCSLSGYCLYPISVKRQVICMTFLLALQIVSFQVTATETSCRKQQNRMRITNCISPSRKPR